MSGLYNKDGNAEFPVQGTQANLIEDNPFEEPNTHIEMTEQALHVPTDKTVLKKAIMSYLG